jgi:hypothetical protein
MTVMPVPGEPTSASQSCPNCGARLAEDQRYCLNCGRPCSPVRLAFLDVLQSEHAAPGGIGAGGGLRAGAPQLGSGDTQILAAASVMPPVLGYPPTADPSGGVGGWLRRHAGVLSLISILLISGLIGLLIGHWVSAGSGSQTVKLVVPSGLSLGAPAAASTTPSSAAPGGSGTAAAHPASKAHTAAKSEPVSEAEEEKEAQEIESKPAQLPTPKKTSHSTLKKLESSTGKKHTEELEKNGTAPIETGG